MCLVCQDAKGLHSYRVEHVAGCDIAVLGRLLLYLADFLSDAADAAEYGPLSHPNVALRPDSHGTSVKPSGLLPSVLLRPCGSLTLFKLAFNLIPVHVIFKC